MPEHSQSFSTRQTPIMALLGPASDAMTLLRMLALVLAGVGVLTLSAKVSVPFYPVPVTMQTLAVLLIGAAYGWRLGALTVLAYVGHGLAGLPVFTGTPPAVPGLAYLLGPTGGFVTGFLPAVIIAGLAVERGLASRPVALFAALLGAEVLLFGLGFGWLAFGAHLASGAFGLGVAKAFALGVAPFALGDLLKTVLATLLIVATARFSASRMGGPPAH
jgi:biotin transport system substrate-specific component